MAWQKDDDWRKSSANWRAPYEASWHKAKAEREAWREQFRRPESAPEVPAMTVGGPLVRFELRCEDCGHQGVKRAEVRSGRVSHFRCRCGSLNVDAVQK